MLSFTQALRAKNPSAICNLVYFCIGKKYPSKLLLRSVSKKAISSDKYTYIIYKGTGDIMDKIKITSFRDEIASAILNSQEKLNFHKNEKGEFDAYIDEEELPAVLSFFGEKDVTKLLKSEDNQSVFENQEGDSQAKKTDKFEYSKYKIDEDDAISNYATAANELDVKTRTSLSLTSAGTPYVQLMESIENELAEKKERKEDATAVIYKKEALQDMVLNYMREHPEADKEHLIVREITYGKDGSKRAVLSQTFGLNGNSAYDNNSVSDNDKEGGSEDDSKNSSANADLTYNVDFRTLNTKERGNWHIKGTVKAGSNNTDLHGAAQYTKQYKNGSVLNFTGNFRETIKDKDNITSAGASADYRIKKFSTGAYGLYTYTNENNQNSTEKNAEVYAKYSKSIMATFGVQGYEEGNYYYTKGLVQGKRDFPDSGLSINGGIGGEYGFYRTDIEGFNENVLELRVKGGISFKSNDFSAGISGDVTAGRIKADYMGNSAQTKTTIASFLGNISTKNIDFSATVSAINVDPGEPAEGALPQGENKASVTANVKIGFKNIFGKNVEPFLNYTVGRNNGTAQNIGAGIIVTP